MFSTIRWAQSVCHQTRRHSTFLGYSLQPNMVIGEAAPLSSVKFQNQLALLSNLLLSLFIFLPNILNFPVQNIPSSRDCWRVQCAIQQWSDEPGFVLAIDTSALDCNVVVCEARLWLFTSRWQNNGRVRASRSCPQMWEREQQRATCHSAIARPGPALSLSSHILVLRIWPKLIKARTSSLPAAPPGNSFRF